MLAGKAQPGNKVMIRFEANMEVVHSLKDLVKHYKMPISDVIGALVCYEHESLRWKDEPDNE